MANKDKIEKLEDLIKDTIEGELVDQTVTPLLPPGENYGSVMYKVDFKVKKDGKEKEYHAVAKCTPPNQVTQEIFNTQETFKSEIAWYTTVIPTFKKFAKEQGMERKIDFFQTFYGARISLDPNSDKVDLDGVILTENLKYLGYNNVDRHIGFDLSTTQSVLRDLATFHAISLALRYHNVQCFKENIEPYLPGWVSCGEKMEYEFKKPIPYVFGHIPEATHLTEKIKKRMNESDVIGNREVREPWVTVVHLDFWSNNVMVNAESNTVILDFQSPRCGSPAVDVVFFLLTSIEAHVIENRLDNFFKFYHDEFIKNLKQLNVSTDEFSFESFLKEIDIEARGGELAHALGHFCVILGEKGEDNFNDANENFEFANFSFSQMRVNERHLQRFRWLAKEAEKRNWF